MDVNDAYFLSLRYWLTNKIHIKRPSTGLLMYTLATRFCDEIHLYGFWPFPKDSQGNTVKYHYYDTLKYRYFSNAGPHRMPLEFKTLKTLHSKGALKLTTSKCTKPWSALADHGVLQWHAWSICYVEEYVCMYFQRDHRRDANRLWLSLSGEQVLSVLPECLQYWNHWMTVWCKDWSYELSKGAVLRYGTQILSSMTSFRVTHCNFGNHFSVTWNHDM